MKIKNLELGSLSFSLKHLKNTGLTGDKAWKIVDLQEDLDSNIAVYQKAHKAIMEEFLKEGETNIKEDDDRYEAVSKKISEMNDEEVTLKTFGFLSKEELIGATKDLNFEMIKILKTFLGEKEITESSTNLEAVS